MHAGDRAAEHGLYGVRDQRFFYRNYEIDVVQVLFQPALNAGGELVHTLEHDGPFGLLIESQHGVAAEFPHDLAKLAAGLGGQQIAMEGFSAKRTGDGAVGADQPEVEAEQLSNGQSKGMATSGDQDDFDTGFMSAAQRGQVEIGDLKFRVEQGAVDIRGEETDWKLHHA